MVCGDVPYKRFSLHRKNITMKAKQTIEEVLDTIKDIIEDNELKLNKAKLNQQKRSIERTLSFWRDVEYWLNSKKD
jgi:hypothetical protein